VKKAEKATITSPARRQGGQDKVAKAMKPGAGKIESRRSREDEKPEKPEKMEKPAKPGKAWPLTGTALHAGRRTSTGAADLRRAVVRLVSRLMPVCRLNAVSAPLIVRRMGKTTCAIARVVGLALIIAGVTPALAAEDDPR